jgi:ethanolamine phosphate transferase 2 subunit G
MSNAASNYDLSRLAIGQSVAVISCILSVVFVLGNSSGPITLLTPLAVIAISYGVMMFASSYVEEEHHFWYWMSSAWIALLAVRQFRRYFSLTTLLLSLQLTAV